MIAWVPVKKRTLVRKMVERWAGMDSYALKDLSSIVGFFRYLDIVLKCFPEVLGEVQAFMTQCTRAGKERKIGRNTRCWKNSKVGEWLDMMLRALEGAGWEVPIIDWEWDGEEGDVCVQCDAACPKESGLEYEGGVWGMGAWVEGEWFYARTLSDAEVSSAKRKKSLSSPFLEAVNYVDGVEMAMKKGARRIVIKGDCKPAIRWFEKLNATMRGSDEEERKMAMNVIQRYVAMVIKNGLLVKFVFVPREDLHVADALSRGDKETISRMENDGMERVVAQK